VDYQLIKGAYDVARRQAERLLQRRQEEDDPLGNPSTDVFLLLDQIKVP
jgi:hypothetical protein